MGSKERENQIDFIQKVKEFMYFSPKHFGTESPADFEDDLRVQEIDQIPSFEDSIESKKEEEKSDIDKFEELMRRIENLEKEMKGHEDKSKQSDGIRKTKIKSQVMSLLKEHKKLSSYELSRLVGLSRTRCNEYFRELAKEGLTEGVIIDRKKFYRLMKR